MNIALRCDKNGNFGFVEKFKTYYYNNGAISILALADVGNFLSKPFVYRGEEFLPAEQIDNEKGVDKYIKAKKPFYSVLGNGNILLDMKVAFDLKTKEYIKEKSSFKLYGVVKDSLSFDKEKGWSVKTKLLTSSSSQLDDWLEFVAKKVAETGDNREMFLKSRF